MTLWKGICLSMETIAYISVLLLHSEGDGYSGLYYTIVIKRSPTFYDLVIVKPAVMLGVMTMFIFLAPATAADRYAYGTRPSSPSRIFSNFGLMQQYQQILTHYSQSCFSYYVLDSFNKTS